MAEKCLASQGILCCMQLVGMKLRWCQSALTRLICSFTEPFQFTFLEGIMVCWNQAVPFHYSMKLVFSLNFVTKRLVYRNSSRFLFFLAGGTSNFRNLIGIVSGSNSYCLRLIF